MQICLFLKDSNMAVYANDVNKVSRCKTTGFYDSEFFIQRRDPLNKIPLVDVGVIRHTETYGCSF